MNTCPNCGKNITDSQAVCECGELLRAEVTQHVQGWETETVFRAADAVTSHRKTTVAVILVVVAAILVLAWPQFDRRLLHSDADLPNRQSDGPTVVQNPSQSDIVPGDDIVQSEAGRSVTNEQGVFEFAPDGKTVRAAKLKSATVGSAPQYPTAAPASEMPATNALDAQLLSDKPGTPDAKSPSDCKPEITAASLKKPDEPADNKASAKQASTVYTLGPRGGCFFVTPSGSKKYVDHSLCSTSTIAAARQ